MCPWAYQTSVWIREARQHRDIDVRWRFFSLEEVNRQEGKKHPWERDWSYGWSMLRVAALLRRLPDGNTAVDDFYAAAGRTLHIDGVKVQRLQGSRPSCPRSAGTRAWWPKPSPTRPRTTM
jgi:predicted DsbA family dithiol-disulfide isomerase